MREKAGYYDVKQLLKDDSLYEDARLANELANARLTEEARLRQDRIRRHEQHIQQLKHEQHVRFSEHTCHIFLANSKSNQPKPN